MGRAESQSRPHKYSHLIFDRGAEAAQRRKDSPFSHGSWNNWIASYKNKARHRPHTRHRINSKWIRLKCETQNYELQADSIG